MRRRPTLLTVVLLVGLVVQLAHPQQGPTQAELDAAAFDDHEILEGGMDQVFQGPLGWRRAAVVFSTRPETR